MRQIKRQQFREEKLNLIGEPRSFSREFKLSALSGRTSQFRRKYDNFLFFSEFFLHRLTSKTLPDAATAFTYGYDLTGLPTTANNPDAAQSWSYDTAGRMIQETRGLLSVQYRYDAAGNRTRITWPDGYYVDDDYDELDRLIVANENGTTPLATYGYDDLSRRTSKLFHNNRETTYGYAANDNLQSLGHGPQGGSQNVAFTYGTNGVSERISLDVSNAATFYRPQQGAIDVYSPNALNQYATVNAQTYIYDGNGNLTDDGVNVYGYDSESRLTSFVSASVVASCRYDALDRRIEKTVEGAITVFLHAGAEEIAEYDSSGNLIRRFVPGAGFGEIIATVEASGLRYFHHEDGLGSTVARSNDAGLVTEINTYGPFGEGTAPHGSNAFGFTGQRFDAESGLYYFRARYYSPALGRFLQPDPASFVDALNLYVYANNSPISFVDPLGLAAAGASTGAYDLVQRAASRVVQAFTNNVTFKVRTGTFVGASVKVFGAKLTVDLDRTSVTYDAISGEKTAQTGVIVSGSFGRKVRLFSFEAFRRTASPREIGDDGTLSHLPADPPRFRGPSIDTSSKKKFGALMGFGFGLGVGAGVGLEVGFDPIGFVVDLFDADE